MGIFDFLSKACDVAQEYAENTRKNMELDEKCRARSMDDYDLMYDYDRLKNCEDNPYSRASIRKDNVAKELQNRDYNIDD